MATTISANQVSTPQYVAAGSLFTVAPANGATAVVEYTADSRVAVQNGAAVWVSWPKGSVTGATSDRVIDPSYVRVTAQGGSVTFDVDEMPSAEKLAVLRADWGFPPMLAQDSSGNTTGIVGADGRAILSQRSNAWLSYLPGMAYGQINAGSTFAGETFATLIAVESDFDAVRVPLFNFDTTNTQTYDAVAVSCASNTVDPTNGAGAWTVATFSGSASVTLPAATSVSGRIQPSIALSDPIYISSIARTDGGTKPLVCIRVYMGTGAGRMQSYWAFGPGSGAGGWADSADGRIWRGYRKTGDFASTAQSSMTASNSAFERGYTVSMGVLYRPRTAMRASVLCIGDSITRGAAADIYGRAWAYKLMKALSTPSAPVSISNAGISGSQTGEFLSVAKRLIPILKPHFAIWAACTPNEMPLVGSMRSNLVQFLDLCTDNQVTPVLWTGTPKSTGANTTPAYTLSDDTARLAYLSSLAGNYGGIVIDTASALSTGTAPTAYANASLTTDGTHPTSAGDDVIASVMRSALAKVRVAMQ